MRSFVFCLIFVLGACSPSSSNPSTTLTPDGGSSDGSYTDDAGVVVGCDPNKDTDADGIADFIEGTTDVDNDGKRNYEDLDSDGDGISDEVEHGSLGPCERADSDGDGILNIFDADSDNDGLSDAREKELGTNPVSVDSDNDGVSDFGEVEGTGTNPNDGASTVPEQDFFVVLPHMGTPEERPLRFSTNIKKADVYFLIDSTGSMRRSIDDIRNKVSQTIASASTKIPDVAFGVGFFRDDGEAAYIYANRADITKDVGTLHNALQEGAIGGGDEAEATIGAIRRMFEPRANCAPGHTYQPCFRPGALPIVVVVTDAPIHGRTGTYQDAANALSGANARLLCVSVGNDGYNDLKTLARVSGAVRADGTELVYRSNEGNVSENVSQGIASIADQVRQDISTRADNVPGNPDDVDGSRFISSIAAVEGYHNGAPGGYVSKSDSAFQGVIPGTEVDFKVTFHNDFRQPTVPEIHKANIVVIGNNVTNLDSRQVYILVPPVGETVVIE